MLTIEFGDSNVSTDGASTYFKNRTVFTGEIHE